ncbi:MAG: PD40 domain-containing protein [Thaumarchaeota archaeon]|nr:PD40 domain-containing protein [Nitrososphaerota archaeon]
MRRHTGKIFVTVFVATVFASAFATSYTEHWWRYSLSTREVELKASAPEPIRLTNSPIRKIEAVWSPDERRIAYVSEEPEGSSIWVMNGDRTQKKQLTPAKMNAHWPRWRPDGGMIAFMSYADKAPDLWVMYSDGHGKTNLANDTSSDSPPEWSPDGSLITYESNKAGNWDVWSVSVGGAHRNQLTTNPADDRYPTWSPDGKKITFASNRSGNFDIWIMDTDGSGQKRITSDPRDDIRPRISPFGNRVAYLSNQSAYWPQYTLEYGAIEGRTWSVQVVDLQAKVKAFDYVHSWLLRDSDWISWSPNGKIIFPSYEIAIQYGIYINIMYPAIFMLDVGDKPGLARVSPAGWAIFAVNLGSHGVLFISEDRHGYRDVYVSTVVSAPTISGAAGY